MKVQLLERAPSVWRVRIETGKDGNGKRRFSYETVRGTREDAEARRRTLLNDYEEGSFTAPDKITVGAFLKQWIKNRHAMRKIGRASFEQYNMYAQSYIIPHVGGLRLQRLTGSEIQMLYTKLATEGRTRHGGGALSLATVHLIHRMLSSALKGARKAKLLKASPMEEVESPPKPKRKPKAVNEATAQQLMDTLAGHWMEPIAVLGFSTGMRRGELCGLRWGAVDLDKAWIEVRGQLKRYRDNSVVWEADPKTDSGYRTIAISDDVAGMLRKMRHDAAEHRLKVGARGAFDDAYVLTVDGVAPVRPDRLSRAFSVWCDTHGLPAFTFHATRHTHLTALLRKVGVAGAKMVSQRAGHAQVTTTLDLYQTIFAEDDRALAEMSPIKVGGKGTVTPIRVQSRVQKKD